MDIVGYQYRADIYCPDCIGQVLTSTPAYDGWQLAPGIYMPVEDNLAEIALAFGIDRFNESSFDSWDFPKVVFDTNNVCGRCGEWF